MTTDRAILNKFTLRGHRTNLPWLAWGATRNELAELFGELGFKSGVEIGTRHGEFAEILCQKNKNLHLYCVDPWLNYSGFYLSQARQDRIYAGAVKRLQKYNTEILKMGSMDAVSKFADGSLDFVYIDANHDFDYVMMDIIKWVPKVKSQGIVACHDYHPFINIGVIVAIEAYVRCHQINPWYITHELYPTAFWVQK